jgi:autotransporter-associated beta strand protein
MPNSVNTLRLSGTGNTFSGGINFSGGKLNQSILESSPASGTNGALGIGTVTLGVSSSGSSATLNLGGSPATVTEKALITIAGTAPGSGSARMIAVVGVGDRILSGTVGVQAVGVTLACQSSGNLTFANTIQNVGPITISSTGSGHVIFSGSNTYTGATTVSQGTLRLATATAVSSSASAVTVAAGATLSVGPQVAAVVPTLVNNGLVDVGLGGLTVTTGQTATGIVAAIIAGRTDGTWSGTSGITSSAAATQSERAVGWLNNGDGSFTVAFGAAGDWNLNGVVDFDDVVQFVSANLYDTGLPATWADGDYDYNGVVDFDDVVASVSANLFDTGPYNTAPGGLALTGFGGEDHGLMNGGFAAVPEPATWLLGAAGMACAAGWRRQRKRVIAKQMRPDVGQASACRCRS